MAEDKKIIQVTSFKEHIKTATKKRIVVIHGTAGDTVNGSIEWFAHDGVNGVGVTYFVDKNGDIYQMFDEKFGAYHAGQGFGDISKYSVSIECVNMLAFHKVGNDFYNYVGKKVDIKRVFTLKSEGRNIKYMDKLTDSQIQSLSWLTGGICDRWKIPKKLDLEYNSKKYLDPKYTGVLLHSSFHKGKSDFPPEMFESFKIA